MLKIAITGSTGMIGSRMVELLKNDFIFVPLTQEQLDITNRETVFKTLSEIDFDIFFHLAAYTNVDGAETQKELCYKINVEGTKNVFEATQANGKQFVLVSTDFVFDGSTPPYTETSDPNPIGYYGQTKYEAEQLVKGQAMIIRPSYPYRKEFTEKKDFVRVLKSLLEQGKELNMITDSLITPTFIDDFAFAVRELLQNFTTDIFHVVGADSLSPFEAGKLIAQTFHLDESLVQPTTYDEYFAGKAKRPKNARIISLHTNSYPMNTFKEGLKQLL
ncbi:sugar nucleotide-binding protein [Candidatus Roizmanbacteria bacterium]|nr:sugar nucleotide-binding protein [Candidatus Roizmanbacteria bacterium]